MLVMLPGVLAALAWFPEARNWWSAISGLLVASGVPFVLAQLGRDRGKRKEPMLFESWGGKPTTRLLRHRDTSNKVLLARRHRKLQGLLADIRIPTAEEEQRDPISADAVYDACVAFLLEKTRDKKHFPLVFEENCSYGFRRNLWGMKPLGVIVSILGTTSVFGLIVSEYLGGSTPPPIIFVYGLINLILLLLWLFWIAPKWVKVPADAYAERLLAACEDL